MKQEIKDIKDITYSIEIYGAKPKPWVSGFIYIFLAFFVVSVLFMYFFQIDVVIKAIGVVRPNQQVSTIKSLKNGEVIEINYEEGKKVQKGEILLVLDYSTQKIAYKQLLDESKRKKEEIKQLEKYIIALKTEKNIFDEEKESLYYSKFEKFKWNQALNQDQLNYEKLTSEAEIASLSKNIKEINNDMNGISKVLQAIKTNNNLTGIKGYYLDRFTKYQLDYDELKRGYEDKIFEISNNQSLDYSKKSLADMELKLFGNQQIMDAILAKKENLVFPDSESYSDKELDFFQKEYQEYINKKNQLEDIYRSADEKYELYLSLEQLAITKSQLDEAERNMRKAKFDKDNYILEYSRNLTKEINDLELELLQSKFQNQKELSKIELLDNIKQAESKALQKLTKDEIVRLEEKQKENQKNLIQYELALEKAKMNSKKNTEDPESQKYANILYLKSTEILSAIEQKEKLQESVREFEAKLSTINQEIQNSIIIASQAGKINITNDIVVGDQIVAGTEIFTIVPDENTAYKVQILVNNKDIAKIKVGDRIKYQFQALPQKEYGNLSGKILKISSDVKYDAASKMNYYSVEASLNEREVYSYKGEKAQVKIGMVNEARVISEQKSILRFLLEKINLLD